MDKYNRIVTVFERVTGLNLYSYALLTMRKRILLSWISQISLILILLSSLLVLPGVIANSILILTNTTTQSSIVIILMFNTYILFGIMACVISYIFNRLVVKHLIQVYRH